MKSLMYYGRGSDGHGDFRVEDSPVPELTPGSVEVDVDWCGICGSDLHEYEADTVSGYTPPVILGHEFSGVVSAVGDGVDNVRVGERVTVEPFMYCQTCDVCLTDEYHLCANLGVVGVHSIGGGFAEKAVIPAYTVHGVPDSVSPEVAALCEPIAVGWHAMRMANLKPGQTALVIGAGPIGLTSLMCAQAFGASMVAVSVRRPGAREDAAVRLNADVILDSSKVDVAEHIMELTGGRGVDVVFECSGAPEGMDTAMKALKIGGTIVSLSVWLEPAPCDYMQVLLKEARIVGSKGYSGQDFPQVIEALAEGRIRGAEQIITTKIDLDEVISHGFAELESDRTKHVKVLVRP